MADPDATLRGILERNVAAAGAGTAAHHLNHVTIELDASEVGALGEGLEGLPVSVEGHFEAREHPESGTRWVFKAHALREDVPVDNVPNELPDASPGAPPRGGRALRRRRRRGNGGRRSRHTCKRRRRGITGEGGTEEGGPARRPEDARPPTQDGRCPAES
jgi:hypothetical protein